MTIPGTDPMGLLVYVCAATIFVGLLGAAKDIWGWGPLIALATWPLIALAVLAIWVLENVGACGFRDC